LRQAVNPQNETGPWTATKPPRGIHTRKDQRPQPTPRWRPRSSPSRRQEARAA
jgi:hypothetical protein